MKQKVYWIMVMIMMMSILTGCWSRRELNELAIAVAMGVDKSGDQFKVSAQIVNPGEVAAKKGGGGNSPVATYTATGDTVFEALRKMTTKSPRKIYAAHLRLFVIGEELAKEEGIGKILDLLSRDQELRTDYYIIVSKGTTAEQVLKILSIPLEKIPANKMFQSLQSSEKAWAVIAGTTMDELISDLVSIGHNPLLSGLEIVGDPKRGETQENLARPSPPAVLVFNGMAAFKKDKLIGWLDEKESKGANYITDKVKSTIVNIQCTDDGFIGIELIRSKTKVTGSVHNETPSVTVSVKSEANVADVECAEVDLSKNTTIYDLEKKAEEEIKKKMEAAIKAAQEDFETDIFGFGEVIHRENPKYWKKHKESWEEEFVDIPVKVNVDIKIRRIGTVGNTFLKQLEE
jgi:spore germination protein KC